MRLSICKDDPGYDLEASFSCRVYLDGEDVTFRCFTADEEEGTVWLNKHNDAGESFVDQSTGRIAKETLSGKVEIVLGVRD